MTCDRSVVFSGFSTNKTDRHDIPEILLKLALNTIKQTKQTIDTIYKTYDRLAFHRDTILQYESRKKGILPAIFKFIIIMKISLNSQQFDQYQQTNAHLSSQIIEYTKQNTT